MEHVWNSVTAAQATIISGVCTLAAALFGVLFGWWLFSGRVSDLKSAIKESDNLIKQHRSDVQVALTGLGSSLSDLQLQFSTTLEALGQLRGSVSDIQSSTLEEPANETQANRREQVRSDWNAIRDVLERTAAAPDVDGRTRAKYARIDRRKYWELVDALARDGALAKHEDAFRQAVALWMRYRNGRREPTTADATSISNLRAQLVG